MAGWECYACTWVNNECDVDCSMCQTKRARNLSPIARKNEESTVCRQADGVSNNAMQNEETRQDNNDDNNSKELSNEQDSISIEQHSEPSYKLKVVSATESNKSNSKWDAFASLENNYESSDSDEDDSESDDDGSKHYFGKDEYNEQYDDDIIDADQSQWNAFESLKANLGDDSSSSGEESDCILIEDEEEEKMAAAASFSKRSYKTECVDLVDTDDEEDVRQEKNSKPKRINSRKRKRASDPSAITLMDGDSDSSYLSEVESSRPFQSSPATRQGIRSLPPWQRAARSKTKSPSILQDDSVLPRESFSLLSKRNDVNGSGLNETRTSAPAARQPKQRKSSTKSSTSTKTGSKSRRRKRSNSDGAAAAPAKKKRRTQRYRRSSKRGGRGGAAAASSRNNNPWGARERGIRQPIRNNNGSGSYMNITKQEPMLRNIGGASIQF